MTDDLVKRLRNVSEESMYAEPFTTKTLADAAADRIEALEAALREADQFITNGIELGYIRMPDADVPDPAHHIPRNIRAALAGEKKDG